MNRHEKEQVVNFIKTNLQDSEASFLVGYRGLSVSQITGLRQQLREKGAAFKVAKLSLMRRAIDEVPEGEPLKALLADQLAFVFASQETPSVAKVLHSFANKNESLAILAGLMDSSLITQEQVKLLASLPSREVLLGQVCGTLNAPITSFVCLLNMLIIRLLYVLKQIEEKKAAGQ